MKQLAIKYQLRVTMFHSGAQKKIGFEWKLKPLANSSEAVCDLKFK